jgi:hypothetical protein
MTSSRLLKFFTGLSALSALWAFWLWHATGDAPDPWLIRLAGASFLGSMVLGLVDPVSRPRLMLRFLAALFALATLIALAADISRPPAEDGHSQGAISLMQHLQTLAPSLVAELERTVSRSIGPFAWDPVLTSVLALPASLIFLLLATAAGWLGRPRRRVRIFVNDH